MKQRGFILPSPALLYGAIAAGVLILSLGATIWIQTARLDSCEAEHTKFVTEVRVLGEQAVIAKENKEKKDADQIKGALSVRDAALAKLRERPSRSASPILPQATDSTGRICLDRAKFESAFGSLDKGLQGIAETGDTAIINGRAWLDSWPKE